MSLVPRTNHASISPSVRSCGRHSAAQKAETVGRKQLLNEHIEEAWRNQRSSSINGSQKKSSEIVSDTVVGGEGTRKHRNSHQMSQMRMKRGGQMKECAVMEIETEVEDLNNLSRITADCEDEDESCDEESRDGRETSADPTKERRSFWCCPSFLVCNKSARRLHSSEEKNRDESSIVYPSIHCSDFCCCPPAITAIFCLWMRSGFSKASVAGALTFFPPEPPFYTYERIDRNGVVLPDEPLEADSIDSDDDDDDEDDELLDICDMEEEVSLQLEREKTSEAMTIASSESLSSSVASAAVAMAGISETAQYSGSSGLARGVAAGEGLKMCEVKTCENHQDIEIEHIPVEVEERSAETKKKKKKKKKKKAKSAATALSERSRKLHRRGNARNLRDGLDAAAGVTYRFVPDLRLSSAILDPESKFPGTIEAVKIGPHPKTKTYIATLIYRVRPPPNPSSEVRAEHGDIRRWFAKTKTILFSHGNATDMGAMNFMQSLLACKLNANVVMFDYSGFGQSGGVALESNTYRDIMMVYDYVVENVATDGDARTVVAYGQSVGSGPCCYLASKEKDKLGGLILHSPFTSGMRILTSNRTLACLDVYPNIDRIRKVQCPVMIIHGQNDEEINCSHGVALYQAVPPKYRREPWWVPHRGHNDITEGSRNMAEYLRRVRLFLEELD